MREPDIEIGASVKADELRFETVPDVDVTFTGDRASSTSGSDRENLPDRVEPGVTYRDVRVRWHAVAHIGLSEDDPKEARP